MLSSGPCSSSSTDVSVSTTAMALSSKRTVVGSTHQRHPRFRKTSMGFCWSLYWTLLLCVWGFCQNTAGAATDSVLGPALRVGTRSAFSRFATFRRGPLAGSWLNMQQTSKKTDMGRFSGEEETEFQFRQASSWSSPTKPFRTRGRRSIDPFRHVADRKALLCNRDGNVVVAAAGDPTTAIAQLSRAGATPTPIRPLEFWETMVCGAISRSVAQTIMHPANTMKTILQNSKGPLLPTIMELVHPSSFRRLTYGAGTNFLLSVPQGALNFSVLEYVRKQLGNYVATHPYLKERAEGLGAGLDFISSSISTVAVSIVATPQMMITDNIMAGNYPNLPAAVKGLFQSGGVRAFYRGWSAGMFGKIPSYGLTWTLFQQLKVLRQKMSDREATNVENSIMGAIASTSTVCIMIPLDTIKTRLVTQGGIASVSQVPYKGIADCAIRVFREEGIGAFYRGLPPRLVSVVPMIGIQFAVYEATKNIMLKRPEKQKEYREKLKKRKKQGRTKKKEEQIVPPGPVTIHEDVEEV